MTDESQPPTLPPSATNRGGRPVAVQVNLSKRTVFVLVLTMLVPWLCVGYLVLRHSTESAGFESEPAAGMIPHREVLHGPWGELDVEPITLDYPSSHAVFDFDLQPFRQWSVKGASIDAVRVLFAKAALADDVSAALMLLVQPDPKGGGFVIHPPDAIVRGFAPDVRAALYTELARNPRNAAQAKPFRFRGATVREWFVRSGVGADVVAQIEPLLYRRGNELLFSDPQLVVPGIESRDERVRLYRTLHRTSTLRVRIRGIAGEKPGAMAEYWGRPNRQDNVEALVTAMGMEREGLSILAVLPTFARTRLYTYPRLTQGDDGIVRDCHWSSLNFFNDPPDDTVSMHGNVVQILSRDYERITSPTHLGDVVMLFAGDTLVHSCNYLAGDIVFTKNGLGSGDPFILERLDDVIACYRPLYGEIKLGFCRRKGM